MSKINVVILGLCLTGCADYSSTCEPTKLRGLNTKELIAICGQPKKINYSGLEQWIYGGRYDLYVYISNDKVDSIQWTRYP